MVKVRDDLTGKFFGKWTVIGQADDWITPKGQHEAQWLCQCGCDAKVRKIVRGRNLKNGSSRSCGCLIRENAYFSDRDEHGNFKKKTNDYEIQENYVIMYTYKNEIILVDLEDFWKVKNYSWTINSEGYVITTEGNKNITMHRLIMNNPKNSLVDHIHGDNSRNDNRKSNLRIVTHSQNQMNKKPIPNRYSNVTGVSWHKKEKYWCAYIGINGKQKYLGCSKSFDEAVEMRKKAEVMYYGEYSYKESQNI